MTVSEAMMALNTATQLKGADDAVATAEKPLPRSPICPPMRTLQIARASVTAAQALVDALEDGGDMATRLATADADLTGHEMRIATRIAGEKVVADTAAAVAKTTAIGDEADQQTDAGLGGDGADPTTNQIAGEYNLAIEYGSTTITVETSTDADDNEMFTDAMAGLDRGRTMLDREMDPDMMTGDIVREISIVGTDIEAPVATAFAMFERCAADGTTTTPQAERP